MSLNVEILNMNLKSIRDGQCVVDTVTNLKALINYDGTFGNVDMLIDAIKTSGYPIELISEAKNTLEQIKDLISEDNKGQFNILNFLDVYGGVTCTVGDMLDGLGVVGFRKLSSNYVGRGFKPDIGAVKTTLRVDDATMRIYYA